MKRTYIAPTVSLVEMEVEAIIAQSVIGSTSQGVGIDYGGVNSNSGLDADVRENGIWGGNW